MKCDTGSDIIYLNICSPQKPAAPRVLSQEDGREGNNLQSDGMIVQRLGRNSSTVFRMEWMDKSM